MLFLFYRQPVQYNSINSVHTSTGSYTSHDSDTAAVLSRYKYYNKLAPHSDSTFVSTAVTIQKTEWLFWHVGLYMSLAIIDSQLKNWNTDSDRQQAI